MHRLLRRQGHGGGSPVGGHIQRLQCAAGDFLNQGVHAERHKVYRKTYSLDSPSDRHGIRLSDSLHRRACCEPQVADLQSMALSVPTPLGTRGPKSVRDEIKKIISQQKECVFGRHILFRIMESKWIISY